MLQLSNPVYNLFELVLTSLTNFILDCIEKFLGCSEITLEEDLELFSYDENNSKAFNVLFILLLVI